MKKALTALQGAWAIVDLEIDGRPMPTGEAQVEIKGDRFTASGMGTDYAGIISVDLAKKPNTLDMTFTSGPEKGNRNLGIFQVTGDTWRLCLDMTGKSRPKKFASAPGKALETLKRVDAASSHKKKNITAVPKFDVIPAPELEGEWIMEACTINGEPLPSAYAKYGKRVARNNEITVTMAGQVLVKARFTVDRARSPHTIDYLLANGQPQYGIYELTGKNLKVIFAAPGQPRPHAFVTTKGDGNTLTTWKQVRP